MFYCCTWLNWGSLDSQCKNKMFIFPFVITDISMKSPQILYTDFTVLYSSDLSHMLQPIDGQPRSLEFRTKQGITTKHRRRGPLFRRKSEALVIIALLWERNVGQTSRIEWHEQKLLHVHAAHQSDIKNTLSHKNVQECLGLTWAWENEKQTTCTLSPQQQCLALWQLLNLCENLMGSRKEVMGKRKLL